MVACPECKKEMEKGIFVHRAFVGEAQLKPTGAKKKDSLKLKIK